MTAPIQARIDPVTLAIQPCRGARSTGVGGAIGSPIQSLVRVVAAAVETFLDAIAAAVRAVLNSFAAIVRKALAGQKQ
jgi:hypothetical protein